MSAPTRNSPPGAWAHTRAILVTLHVLAVILGAFPAPVGGLQRSAWAEPTVARELDTWHKRLQTVGLADDRAAFEDDLYAVASGWVQGRKAVLAPVLPYYRYLGVEQSWRMFVAPHKHPSRLQIHVRAGATADWEPLYEHGHPEYRWHAEQFRHTRMRSALFRYSWPGYRRNFRALARWVGRQVARERPEASHVRLQWIRRRTPSPEQVRSDRIPKATVIRPYVVDLSKLSETSEQQP